MQNAKRRTDVLGSMGLALALAMVWVLTGCSDAQPRQQSRALREQTETARRVHANAADLMGSPVFKVDGQFAPLTEVTQSPAQADDITLVEPGTMDPRSLEMLEKAANELGQSISANSQADSVDLGQATLMLGQLNRLMGFYHEGVSLAGRNRARTLGDEITARLGVVRARQAQLAYFDQLMGLSLDDVKTFLSESSERAESLTADKTRLEGEIKDLTARRNQLRTTKETKTAAMRNKRIDSQLAADPDTRARLFEQAHALQKEINKLNAQIARTENQIAQTETALSQVMLDLDGAKAKLAAANEVLSNRNQVKEDATAGRRTILAQIAELREEIETLTTRMGEALASADQAEQEALSKYDSAASNFNRAAGNLDSDDPAPVSLKGAALMDSGSLQTAKLRAYNRAVGVVEAMQETLEIPNSAAGKKVTAYVSDPEQLRASADEAFEKAVKAYSTAVRRVQADDPKLAWAYQGRLGAAYLSRLDVCPPALREGIRKSAEDTLNDALEDRADSPYLAPVAGLKDLADSAAE